MKKRKKKRGSYNTTIVKGSLTDVMNRLEKTLILEVLTEFSYNCTEAAKFLKINRTTLVEKRRQHGLL